MSYPILAAVGGIDFDPDYFFRLFPKILPYIPRTLLISLLSLILALLLGIILALFRQYRVPVLSPLTKVYVSFFRCTPFIAQLYLFYYGFAQVSHWVKDLSPFQAILIALSVNYSAYMSENIRGALNSVDRSQYEAALSIGMRPVQAARRIILPQAFRVALPSLGNDFINLIKSTAIGFTITLKDIMGVVKQETSTTWRFLEPYTASILIYWVLIGGLSLIQNRVEARWNEKY